MNSLGEVGENMCSYMWRWYSIAPSYLNCGMRWFDVSVMFQFLVSITTTLVFIKESMAIGICIISQFVRVCVYLHMHGSHYRDAGQTDKQRAGVDDCCMLPLH